MEALVALMQKLQLRNTPVTELTCCVTSVVDEPRTHEESEPA